MDALQTPSAQGSLIKHEKSHLLTRVSCSFWLPILPGHGKCLCSAAGNPHTPGTVQLAEREMKPAPAPLLVKQHCRGGRGYIRSRGFAEEVGSHPPFPLGLRAAGGITPGHVPRWWHGAAERLSDGASSNLILLTALARKSGFGLKWEKSVPLSWDVNGGLAIQELEASFLGLLLLFAKHIRE